jgi:hypothetical protein
MKTEQEWMACFVKADDMFERCKVIRQIRREQHEATKRVIESMLKQGYLSPEDVTEAVHAFSGITFESTQEDE